MSEPKRNCPSCLHPARSVAVTTVQHLAKVAPAPEWDAAWFCATLDCEVVYFREDGEHILQAGVRVPVFQKETELARPVCYCFGHSAADVASATRENGSNRIVDDITKACRQGLDRCEETNPQGRCCLGNVRGVARVAPANCGGCS